MSEKNKPIILVADDYPDNLDLMSVALGNEFRVLVAKSGEQALKLATNPNQIPNLILLDIFMPEIDGYEVFNQLKSNPITSKIPIIFITAFDDELFENKGRNLGADDYITKPISPANVRERIWALLSQTSSD
jgi:putative two-component system response regulator